MALHVLCPKCATRYEVADEQIGQTGTCPRCGTVARIPPPDTPVYESHTPYREMAAVNFEVHRRVIGVLAIVVGGLSALWAVMSVFVAVSVMAGSLPDLPEEPEPEVVATVYAAFAVLSVITGIIQAVAGILLLLKKGGCRRLGIAAGIVSCTSIWGCCVYPFFLGFGIYALVILCNRRAAGALDAALDRTVTTTLR